MPEEKQILDGVKIVLDNGWTVRTQELLQIFDMIGLKNKVSVIEENLTFLEFVYLTAKLFNVDLVLLQQYFNIKS